MRNRSKRYKTLIDVLKKKKVDGVESIITEIQNTSNAKFVESVDLSLKINLKKIKAADASLRTAVELPNGNGKKIKVAVLCDENKLVEAKKSGADIVGSDDLVQKISSGEIKFDKLICTPSMMSKIGKLGKILGPKGLMPNPKLGTVSDNLKTSVEKIKNKLVEIKNDKDGNLGVSIGRKNFPENKIIENYNSLLETIKKEKPAGIKGDFILSAFVTSTMGISYRIKLTR